MNKEIWRDVKGYEGLYQVSSDGVLRAWSVHLLIRLVANGTLKNAF